MQAARLRLPELGDLRRRRLDLRLRSLRRPAEEQRQGRVVACDAARARRHRRAGLGDPPAPAHLGGLRPPRQLHRPARRLPHLQAALPRRSPRPARLRPQAVDAPGRVRRLRPDRGARLQPDVRDDGRAGQGDRFDDLPAPRDRAGDLRQLQDGGAVRAQEAAVRHRPGRQVLPQRDHARQLHLPHPRVRADGDGVLRRRRIRPASGSSTGPRRAASGTCDWACAPTTCAFAPTTPTSSRTTHPRPATSSTSSRSAGPSSRGSPTAATSTCASTPSSPARRSSGSTRTAASATSRT